jgi:hypothetical protein
VPSLNSVKAQAFFTVWRFLSFTNSSSAYGLNVLKGDMGHLAIYQQFPSSASFIARPPFHFGLIHFFTAYGKPNDSKVLIP